MKIKRQKHSVKTKIWLFCSKEEPQRSSWSRIRATGSAEGTEKQQEEDPVAKTREDATVEKQKGDQMKQDDATGAAEGTENQQEDDPVAKT